MTRSTQKLLILGTGTFAEEIADVASEIDGIEPAGFVENQNRSVCNNKIQTLAVYWVDELENLAKTHIAICGLGTTKRQSYIKQAEQLGTSFATLIHPSARISAKTSLGRGTFVSAGAIIAAHTSLAEHVSVNRGALVGHHCRISSFATIGPGANIAGNCRIGNATYIGIGAVILDHVSIGAHSVIGAGAVVTKDVPDNVQVVGVPARIVKENIEGK